MRVPIDAFPPEITIEHIYFFDEKVLFNTGLSSYKALFESLVEHVVDKSNVDYIYMMGNSKTSNRKLVKFYFQKLF